MKDEEDLNGKAAKLKTSITPLGDDDYQIEINLKIAIPVVVGLLLFCSALVYFIWR
jgi:hypothetical protein